MCFHALQKRVNWETLVRMVQSVYWSIAMTEITNFLPVEAFLFFEALPLTSNTCADVKE